MSWAELREQFIELRKMWRPLHTKVAEHFGKVDALIQFDRQREMLLSNAIDVKAIHNVQALRAAFESAGMSPPHHRGGIRGFPAHTAENREIQTRYIKVWNAMIRCYTLMLSA